MLSVYSIEIDKDRVIFKTGNQIYTLYRDGVFYSNTPDGNVPQDLFELRDFLVTS